MNCIRLPFIVALLVLLTLGCSKKEEAPPPPPAAIDDAAAKAAAEKAAREAIEADVAKARTLIDEYTGDEADLEEAKEILKSVLTRDRDHARAYVELARFEMMSGYVGGTVFDNTNMVSAGKFVRHAFSLDPELSEAHLIEARVRLAMEEPDKAEESLEKAELSGVAEEELDAVRAYIAAAYDDDRKAISLADEVIASNAASTTLKFEMQTLIAMRLARQEFRVDAQEAFEKAIAIAPDRAWGYANLGAFHLDNGYIEEGLRAAEQAVETRPYPMGIQTLARASVMRAEELFNRKRQSEAEQVIERLGRQVSAGDPDVAEALGGYYYKLFEETSNASYLDKAIENYRAVLAADPDREKVSKALEIAVQRR